MKVLLLTQWFEPEPTFKGLTFAKALRDAGMEVEVLTGFPNYPIGRLYPGYKLRLIQHEEIEGIKVTRVPLYPSHDRSVLRRIANYLSFAITAFIYGVFFVRRIDVIYAYHPPLSIGAVAVVLKFLRGWRVVLDVQDLWPDTLKATGMLNNEKVLSLIGRAGSFIYRWCDMVVVLSKGFQEKLVSQGVPRAKVEVIHNWADEEKLRNCQDVITFVNSTKTSFNILFAGNIGSAQSLDVVVDAAVLLKERKSGVRFILLGAGLEVGSLQNEVKIRGLDNIEFLPSVPMEEVGAYLRAADALLVHLRRDELFKITIPSKTQAYMAVGKPILMAVQGEASDLVRRAACGLVAEPQDSVSLANAADKLSMMANEELFEMGRSGLQFYDNELSLRVGAVKFKKVFKRAIQND
jgi:colanic acid biosynthesis glycosyl transferase WcaI